MDHQMVGGLNFAIARHKPRGQFTAVDGHICTAKYGRKPVLCTAVEVYIWAIDGTVWDPYMYSCKPHIVWLWRTALMMFAL